MGLPSASRMAQPPGPFVPLYKEVKKHMIELSNVMTIIIPNRNLLVRFSGILGQLVEPLFVFLVRRSRAKTPMARTKVFTVLKIR